MNSVEICFHVTDGEIDSLLFEADDDILDRLLWWIHAIGVTEA